MHTEIPFESCDVHVLLIARQINLVFGQNLCVYDKFQGPLEHTAGEFWQMVWEQGSKAVIMLNKVIEKGTVSQEKLLFILLWRDFFGRAMRGI